MPIPAPGDRGGRLAKLALIPMAALVLAACGEQANNNQTGDGAFPNLIGGDGFPHEVVTAQGAQAAGLYLPVFLVAAAIFILVEGLLLVTALRFRRRGKDGELPAQTHGNNRLEFLWTAIPALIVLVMFVGSTIVLARVEDKSEEPAVVLDVLAFRFGWTFTYKDPASYDAATASYQDTGITISSSPSSPSSTEPRDPAQDIVVPVNAPVRFRLNAADVIHSFYVPSFFFKRDAIPGRTNEFEVTIEKPGRYGGQCAEFCGLNHGQMYFNIRAVEQAEYEAWLDEMTGAVLEIATTAEQPIGFTKSSLEARAGQTVTVVYTNDAKVPHNIAFYDGPDATGEQIAMSETITGPGADGEVTFVAPETPGAYAFRCEIHPMQMTGTLTVVP
ncbi:MAG TPA: cytochrome c oxidase subunit II [Candidatus Limnocylindrales bacterium]|nr:cytochrome c oxidase subunit II [Candidatus Limnocylindrales bacterium]